MKEPPTAETLQRIADGLDGPVEDLVRKDSQFKKLELNEGQFVFKAGDKAGQLFLLIAGEIGIFLPNNDSKEPNFYVGHSEIFGEMGVIEDKLRMAYAKCLTKCTVIAVTKAEYEKKV